MDRAKAIIAQSRGDGVFDKPFVYAFSLILYSRNCRRGEQAPHGDIVNCFRSQAFLESQGRRDKHCIGEYLVAGRGIVLEIKGLGLQIESSS